MSGKKKEPLKLKEDTLEVGLDRYRKEENKPPEWLVEYGPMLFIGVFLVILAGPLWLLRGYFFSSSEPSAPMAKLKLIGEPIKVWAAGSTTELESVRVSVGNSSIVSADNVQVIARARDRDFVLTGAASISSGKVEVYEGALRISLKGADSLAVTVTCGNCQ